MFFDSKPCQVCGAEVELRPRTPDGAGDSVDRDADHEPDATVDVRVCTNPSCPSHDRSGPTS